MTPVELGCLLGTMWSSVLVSWTLADRFGDEPHPWLVLLREIYAGFDFTLGGMLIGSVWAFADGFLTGYVAGTLWQWLAGG